MDAARSVDCKSTETLEIEGVKKWKGWVTRERERRPSFNKLIGCVIVFATPGIRMRPTVEVEGGAKNEAGGSAFWRGAEEAEEGRPTFRRTFIQLTGSSQERQGCGYYRRVRSSSVRVRYTIPPTLSVSLLHFTSASWIFPVFRYF